MLNKLNVFTLLKIQSNIVIPSYFHKKSNVAKEKKNILDDKICSISEKVE
jgi:hypothetical protein